MTVAMADLVMSSQSPSEDDPTPDAAARNARRPPNLFSSKFSRDMKASHFVPSCEKPYWIPLKGLKKAYEKASKGKGLKKGKDPLKKGLNI